MQYCIRYTSASNSHPSSTDVPMRSPSLGSVLLSLAATVFASESSAQTPAPELLYSSYLGGRATDDCDALALHPAGRAVLGCHSESVDLPGLAELEGVQVRGMDAVVLQIPLDGTEVTHATHLGGEAWDAVQALAIDADGFVYAVGSTYSADLPATSGAHQSRFGGASDAFVAKIAPTGEPIWVTFLGGDADEDGRGIAVDGAGRVHVVGRTASADFPTTIGAPQRRHGGLNDAFVATFSPEGELLTSTFLGGSLDDVGFAISIDREGRRVIGGHTESQDFAVGEGGGQDVFVATLSQTGGAVDAIMRIGGSGNDQAVAIGTHPEGGVVVAGRTTSSDLPATAGAFQTAPGGAADAFVARVRPSEARLVYLTYLGGSSNDRVRRMVLDQEGRAFIAGQTRSDDFAGHRVGSGDMGEEDAFLSVLTPDGRSAVVQTRFGGSGIDAFEDIAVSPDGATVTLTGLTDSPDLPLNRAAQGRFAGGRFDILVVRFGM